MSILSRKNYVYADKSMVKINCRKFHFIQIEISTGIDVSAARCFDFHLSCCFCTELFCIALRAASFEVFFAH